MSRAAKIFLAASIGVSSFTVWGVHFLQQKERNVRISYDNRRVSSNEAATFQTMFAGVLRDDARQAAKKAERERDFEEQIRRRKFLESQQKVSNASEGSSPIGGSIDKKLKLDPMDEVEFQGCKTC